MAPAHVLALAYVPDRESKNWCGRGDLNPHRPCGPTDFLAATAFAAAIRRLRSGLSLHHSPMCPGGRCCPSSLYTFPSRGLARDCHFKGFPEFGQFYVAGFPARTHIPSPLRLPVSPRPRGVPCIAALGGRQVVMKHCTILPRAEPAGRCATIAGSCSREFGC